MKKELEEFGFYTHLIKRTAPMVNKVTFRKDGFGVGFELEYPAINPMMISVIAPETYNIEMYKVIGCDRKLVFKIPSTVPEKYILQSIREAIEINLSHKF